MGRFLYYGLPAQGHQNTGVAIFNSLLDKYPGKHEVYFIVCEEWKKRLQPKNPRFNYCLIRNTFEIQATEDNKQIDEKDNHPIVQLITEMMSLNELPAIEQLEKSVPKIMGGFLKVKDIAPEIERIISEVQPDLIVLDQNVPLPFIRKGKIPYAVVLSSNPLTFDVDNLPPLMSGLSMKEKDQWEPIRARVRAAWRPFWEFINNWMIESGCPELPPDHTFLHSPHFNIYIYPEELDYFDSEIKLPGEWLRLESPVIPGDAKKPLDLPAEFANLPGKLIYFSLGSLFNVHIPTFQRCLDILAQIPHRFIVAKGPLGDQLRMPKNCWGENYVDQRQIIQQVDIAIVHGGNNSVTEAFYYGTPLIILPIFFDQLDNATRIVECEMGYKLSPYTFTKNEMQSAIDEILNNAQLRERYRLASERIQKDTGMNAILDKILSYAK